MFYYIPAGDCITGKRSNDFSDIQKGYEDEAGITIFLLKVSGRAKPVWLTSFGEYTTDQKMVGKHLVAEHTQTMAHLNIEVLNCITIVDGDIVSVNDKGLKDGTKGAHWVMK